MCFFEEGINSSEELLFQKKKFLRSRYSLKNSFFLIVLRNQFHIIYTWKDFTLTSIHSFKYFEVPQTFIVENSKQSINFNTGCVAMWLFSKLVVIVVSSNKLWKIVLTNSVALVVQKMLQWKFVKNSQKMNSPSLLKAQGCGNEDLESRISL